MTPELPREKQRLGATVLIATDPSASGLSAGTIYFDVTSSIVQIKGPDGLWHKMSA